MPRVQAAAIFDLDRTLVSAPSGTAFRHRLSEAGIGGESELPLGDVLMRFYTRFGENWLMMQPARLASRTAAGWSVADVRAAMELAAHDLAELVHPAALRLIEEHRAAGRLVVLATTSPHAFVEPFAELLGLDDVIASRWRLDADGTTFTGRMDGDFVWGRAKAKAVEAWAADHGVDLARSYAYSDSYFDAPLLALVGHPVAVNPDAQLRATATVRGWPVRHFDKADGVSKIGGAELQEWTRPFMRPGIVTPNARVEIEGIENIPASGAAIVVFNHRSYFDPAVMSLVLAKAGRNMRGLGKKELFDVPLVGRLAKAMGGIRVDRGTGSDEPLEAAIAALEVGELLMMAPEGTIPRGPAFFDPELKGRWGAARLAAATHAPVIPVGLWGTEKVWPRSSRLPRLSLNDRPLVTATVGAPVELKYRSADADTKRIMKAISALLPSESRVHRTPTEDELALTYPPGYRGDPSAEADRRPGTDT